MVEIYDAAKEVWNYPWAGHPPLIPVPGRHLWIEVRCSGGNGKGDPKNRCGDKREQPNDPSPGCPPPRDGGDPPPGTLSNMEVYSDQAWVDNNRYSRITFCNLFFRMRSLKDAINLVKGLPDVAQNNLGSWNNRARCLFHEITHLDYFMNVPDKSPWVDDLIIKYRAGGRTIEEGAYGPYNAKVLRNWQTSGWFTQRQR